MRRSGRLTDRPTLRMFFYGTLKRGHTNHDAFCRDARFLGEATVRGRLYALSHGYPALVVPAGDVLAVGTSNAARDAILQQRLGQEAVPRTEGPRAFGELFAFEDPGTHLAAIDHLEGFDSEVGSGPYRRVLLPVETAREGPVPAWAYVVENTSGTHVPGGRWPLRADAFDARRQ